MQVESSKEFIVDASYISAFLLPDEKVSQEVGKIFEQFTEGEISLASTFLLPFEVANSVLMATRRKRFSSKVALELIERFLELHIFLQTIDFLQAFLLAQKENLTTYDASYVYLAQIRGIPLLSLDKNLHKLAQGK